MRCPDEPGRVQQTLTGCAQYQSDPRLLCCGDPVLLGSHIHCLVVCRREEEVGGRTGLGGPLPLTLLCCEIPQAILSLKGLP